jgi:hypothetical protein
MAYKTVQVFYNLLLTSTNNKIKADWCGQERNKVRNDPKCPNEENYSAWCPAL